jgi:glycosyltransferase involved in cell wall biosynthesis
LESFQVEGFKENISPYLNSSSILLLTSDNEGIPTVVLEAMHAKIPIISRDLGGIKEILSKVPEYPIEIIPEDNLDKAKDIINYLTSNYYEFKNKAELVDTSFFLKERLLEDYIKFIKSLNHIK